MVVVRVLPAQEGVPLHGTSAHAAVKPLSNFPQRSASASHGAGHGWDERGGGWGERAHLREQFLPLLQARPGGLARDPRHLRVHGAMCPAAVRALRSQQQARAVSGAEVCARS